MTWSPGDVIVRREVWQGRPWLANPLYVLEDEPNLLVVFQPVGSPFGFGAGDDWPTATGRHPYDGRTHWVGEGVLGLLRPDDPCAVWHYWSGAARSFVCWYVNIEAPHLRTAIGIDALDLELDLIAFPSGEVTLKDEEHVNASAALGRFSEATAAAIHRLGVSRKHQIASGDRWWDDRWLDWVPTDELLVPPVLPSGWESESAVDRRDLDLLELVSPR